MEQAAAAVAEYVPEAQLEHVDAPNLESVDLPAAQLAQSEAPAAA